MGRVLAIDVGQKRIGLAVSDPLQMIANSLGTFSPNDIWQFLSGYFIKEKVDIVVVGYPVQMSGQGSEALRFVNPFIKKLVEKYPDIEVRQVDERFSSKLAQRAILESGAKKKDRQNKALVDTVSAMIILQDFLNNRKARM